MRRRALIAVTTGLAAASAAGAAPVRAADPATGRLLVTVDRATAGARSAAVRAGIARAGARVAGPVVPQLRLITVRPSAGAARRRATAARLRRQPGVARVEVEHRARLRLLPNDPALSAPDPTPGTPAGVSMEWWAAREDLPSAWDVSRGAGAKVAVIDTGIDASHPEFAGRIAGVDRPRRRSHPRPRHHRRGRPRHPRRLAGLRDRRQRHRHRRLGLRLLAARVQERPVGLERRPVDRQGRRPGRRRDQHVVRDRRHDAGRDARRAGHRLRLPPRRDDGRRRRRRPRPGAGRPGQRAAADGHRQRRQARQGPVGHRRRRDRHAGAVRRPGTQISIAAYGSYATRGPGPTGILGAFPGNTTTLELGEAGVTRAVPLPPGLRRRRALRAPARHVDGRADGGRRGGAHAPPQPRPQRRRRHPAAQADRAAPARDGVDAAARVGAARRRRGGQGGPAAGSPRAVLQAPRPAPRGLRPR